jgi:hypothetical protein
MHNFSFYCYVIFQKLKKNVYKKNTGSFYELCNIWRSFHAYIELMDNVCRQLLCTVLHNYMFGLLFL